MYEILLLIWFMLNHILVLYIFYIREDVWNFAPNLVHVKPYHFFQHTGDINAPPGLSKKVKCNTLCNLIV